MAQRAFPLGATLVALALILPLLISIAAVGLEAQGSGATPADWAAVHFTIAQAVLSAVLSIALAIPVARALARRRFAGRNLLITLLGAPFLMPVIVAIFGLLAVFGRSGFFNLALSKLGLPPVSIYGMTGVVLAHVFLNMPLAVRMILSGWAAIPQERLRLARALSLSPADVFRHIEWPMLRMVLPGIAVAIFAICLTSFAVALILGGGPRATTVELAIYQALRFEFDLPRAALLAVVQLTLCALAVLMADRLTMPPAFGVGLDQQAQPFAYPGWRRLADVAILTLATLFVALPLITVIWAGLPNISALPPSVWQAALWSITIAIPSGAIATAGALVLALARDRNPLFGLVASLPMAISALVMGTGLFLVLREFTNPTALALPVTLVVNAALSLPFAYRILSPEARDLNAGYGRLSLSLGLSPLHRLLRVTLPRLARPLGFAMGVTVALSMGDLGVIALFATEGTATLPLAVQRLMGAYRMDLAAGAASLLVLTSFLLFWIFDQWGRRHAAA
jgi:thiamine transport system permease protein